LRRKSLFILNIKKLKEIRMQYIQSRR